MTLVATVIGVIVVLVVLYIVLSYFFKKKTKLTDLKIATEKQVILASAIPSTNNTSNYTYSAWFYVEDWNYRFGEKKTLLERSSAINTSSPNIVLGAVENDIIITVSCYAHGNDASGSTIDHKCIVRNFPLQSWVNLIISLYGRTLDVYMDGKLVRTCMLPGVAKSNPADNISVTPGGGFKGWTSKIEYWDDSTNPQQAYNIYKAGFGGSVFGSLFNNYSMKFSFMENNKERTSFEI